MRVLLIHPEDELQGEPWSSLKWDRVIDLGRAGAESYARAGASLGSAITSLDEFRENFNEMHRVRELLALGMGRLNDSFGLDWWELTSILVHQQVETAFLLRQLMETLGQQDEVYVSRPCFQAEFLHFAIGSRLHTFSPAGNRYQVRMRHYLELMKKFPARQLLEILWDKNDSGYQFRGSFNRKRKPLSGPLVLLPSAYVNVSRTVIAYAEGLPESRFLLVATRRSGWLDATPPNVSVTWLRRYASVRIPSRKTELLSLLRQWDLLRLELMAVPEFRMLNEADHFAEFPDRFARGLEIRDAWRNVLDSEPVQAVICADDSNPYTHIPLILARQRALPAIACHHGALDGRYMFKRSHADVVLAKGEIEQDYLVRMCGLPPKLVEIGAPAAPTNLCNESDGEDKPIIAYFSEPYELTRGRPRDFYQDVLPSLADLAVSNRRGLVIKLHPSESVAERNRLVEQVLNPGQRRVTRIVSGALQSELLDRVWFGVTVTSSVVVECALRGIPCFLCGWLESWPYGYNDQYSRFGVGIRLDKPAGIRQIPAFLKTHKPSASSREDCWSPIDPPRLRQLLGMDRHF